MSELKEHKFCESDEFFREYRGQLSNEMRPYYLKSEADKVITELEENHKKEVEQLLIEIVELKKQVHEYALGSYILQARAEKEARHHKYKRCLDNAWGCRQRMELFHELVLEEARTIALPNEKALKEYRSKRERAAKWRKRWLKIAEQFKEAK